jgi:hypothetical protein
MITSAVIPADDDVFSGFVPNGDHTVAVERSLRHLWLVEFENRAAHDVQCLGLRHRRAERLAQTTNRTGVQL